jgi:hypothetical protein
MSGFTAPSPTDTTFVIAAVRICGERANQRSGEIVIGSAQKTNTQKEVVESCMVRDEGAHRVSVWIPNCAIEISSNVRIAVQ